MGTLLPRKIRHDKRIKDLLDPEKNGGASARPTASYDMSIHSNFLNNEAKRDLLSIQIWYVTYGDDKCLYIASSSYYVLLFTSM